MTEPVSTREYARWPQVVSVLRQLGPEVTYEQFLTVLDRENLTSSEATFKKYRGKVFRDGEPPAPSAAGTATALAAGPPPARQAPPEDRLSVFIRFALAVEHAGGVDRARGFLDLIERLGASV